MSPSAPRYRSAVGASGASGLDVLIVLRVTLNWDRYYESSGVGGVIFAVVLTLLPFAIAAWLTSTCTAWNGSVAGRCRKPQRGFRRCHLAGHARSSQLLTAPEAAAALALVAGVLNVVLLLGTALH